MKTITLALFALFLVLAGSARGSYVSDIVDQMPAKNSAAESALASKLMSSGAPGVREVCSMLVPLGTTGKDDTHARYAISALVRFAGRPGGRADRAVLAQGLCESLAAANDVEIKTFIVNRLQEVGEDESVSSLAPLLSDERLAMHAAAALERIRSRAAAAALSRALPSAQGATRVAMIKSLGMLRASDASPEIRKSLGDDDKTLRTTAIWALANVGDAGVQDVLTKAIGQEQSAYERGRLYSWALLLTQRLAEAGKKAEASSYCVGMLTDPTGQTPVNVRCSAARLLAQIDGEGSLGTLLPLIEKGDIQFRVSALDAVSKIPGDNVTSALVARLASIRQADLRAELLDALAKRHDAAARPALLAAVKDADPAVRVAAIHALVALDAQEAIPPLVETIVSRNDETAKVAAESLGRIPGDPPLAAAADAINAAPAKAKVALIELLGARVASAHRDVVLKQAADADASVRVAALRAMEKIGSDQDAARLVEIAVAATDGGEQSAALRAAAACAARGTDAEHRADAFVTALAGAKGGKRAAIERAMAKVGGAKALDLVLSDLKSEDVKTRDGALDALAEWQDAAALPPLLEVARTGTSDAQQVTAIRGVIQVIKNVPGTPATTKANAYTEAFAAAKRAEEKKMILGAVGNEKGQEFFDLAARALDDESLRREAALAVIKTALPAAKGQPGLKGAAVSETIKKAIPACPDPNLKSDAERYLKTIAEPTKR